METNRRSIAEAHAHVRAWVHINADAVLMQTRACGGFSPGSKIITRIMSYGCASVI